MLVTSIRKAYSEKGAHCAFTDICTFRGRYYLGFMAGREHRVNSRNKSFILSSAGGVSWSPSAVVYCGLDTREPKFMEFGGKLWAYFFTIQPTADGTVAVDSRCISTEDGDHWSEPVCFATGVKYWRPAVYRGVAYCATHPKDPAPGRYCMLMRSTDGMDWQPVSPIPVEPMEKPNEACLAFAPDGTLVVFIRTDHGKKDAYVLKASPPYEHYESYNLGQRLGGPLLWLDGDDIWLGARFYTALGLPHTGIFQLDAQMRPQLACVLPSMGDSSYMGITKKLQGGGYLASYYSSHESLGGDLFSKNIASVYTVELSCETDVI